jgi:hypothetical protein
LHAGFGIDPLMILIASSNLSNGHKAKLVNLNNHSLTLNKKEQISEVWDSDSSGYITNYSD